MSSNMTISSTQYVQHHATTRHTVQRQLFSKNIATSDVETLLFYLC